MKNKLQSVPTPTRTRKEVVDEYTSCCLRLGELEAKYSVDKNAYLHKIHQLNEEFSKTTDEQEAK